MGDDKKEANDPLTEKYASKEKEIGAALKSGLISEEIAEKILKEYKRKLKADHARELSRNRQARRAFDKAGEDTRARADKAREDALARLEEMRKNQRQAFDPFARQRLGGFNRRDPFRDLDLNEEQQKAIAAIQQKQSEKQLEYEKMMKELNETFQKRMEGILTDEQKEKYKQLQLPRNRR